MLSGDTNSEEHTTPFASGKDWMLLTDSSLAKERAVGDEANGL